jgi:hypothetical protein
VIPRDAVASLQLGIIPQKMLYAGSDSFEGWERKEGESRAWEIQEGGFAATGVGVISRDANLPDKFIIRFSMNWKNHPNFQFRFAEPMGKGSKHPDSYFLSFSPSGLGLYRASAKKGRDTPIALFGRQPGQFQGNSMDIEIRSDRSRGLIEVRIDGVLEGRYTDPLPDIPDGTGIMLSNRSSRDDGLNIGGIEVLAWDDRGDRHRGEQRGDGKADSLIGRYGERFGGRLSGIRTEAGATLYLFKSDFQKEMLELPEEEVSTVFLGGEGKRPSLADSEGLILGLRGKGELRVSSCVFGDATVKVIHPLLGAMEIDRAGIASLVRREIPKAKAPVRK